MTDPAMIPTPIAADPPACRLGGVCDLRSREAVYGDIAPGVGQCVKCSIVYEATGWRPRTCSHCGLAWGESVHDPCLGTIPDCGGACCGHGDPTKRYGVPEGWPIRTR